MIAFISGIAAAWFSTVQSARLGSTDEDTAWAAFFAWVAGTGAGFVAGVLIGALTRLGFGRGFLVGLGLAVVVAAICAAYDRQFGYKPNLLNGQRVVLVVELKLPATINPDEVHNPEESSCWLTHNGDRGGGTLEWDHREQRETDGG